MVELGTAASLGSANHHAALIVVVVLFLLALIWLGLIWPIRVASRIGKRKGRRGWVYPVVGFVFGHAIGAWLGVLIVHWLGPKAGFLESTPVKVRPTADRVVFRDDTPARPAYVPPKRCPDCRGLVPPEAGTCGHCGHGFARIATT